MVIRSSHKPRESYPYHYAVRLALPILWAAVICWLSLTSTPPQIPGPLGWDKLMHAAAYALLTILVAQFLHKDAGRGKAGFFAGCSAVLYGGLMEVLQRLMQTGRTAEWSDLVADIVGAFAGYVIFRQTTVLVSRYHARNQKHG